VTDSEGRPLVVRNGYLPQREIMTGIVPVDIKVPKTRDRGGQGIHFRSELLLRIFKRTKTVLPCFFTSKESQQVISQKLW
jgi:putative transposase